MTRNIDGERKGVLVRIDAGTFRYDGLRTRSEWEPLKAQPGVVLVSMRALTGITLHVQECKGQFPSVGTLIPAKLLKGRSGIKRTGRAMSQHLDAIKVQRKEERTYARALQGARSVKL